MSHAIVKSIGDRMTLLEQNEDPPVDLFDDAKEQITIMLEAFCDNYKQSQYWRTLITMKPRVLLNVQAGYRYEWANPAGVSATVDAHKRISTPYERKSMVFDHTHDTHDHGETRLKLPQVYSPNSNTGGGKIRQSSPRLAHKD